MPEKMLFPVAWVAPDRGKDSTPTPWARLHLGQFESPGSNGPAVLEPSSGHVKGTKAASQSRQGILRLPHGISTFKEENQGPLTLIKGEVQACLLCRNFLTESPFPYLLKQTSLVSKLACE